MVSAYRNVRTNLCIELLGRHKAHRPKRTDETSRNGMVAKAEKTVRWCMVKS